MKRLLLGMCVLVLASCAVPRPPELQQERARGRRQLRANVEVKAFFDYWRLQAVLRAEARYRDYLAKARAIRPRWIPPPRPAPRARAYSVYVPTSTSCGGPLPPCYVLARESGGNPRAQNPHSSASGLWQFVDGTWAGYGGYAHAKDAPITVQNARAAQVWAGGAGASNWAVR